MEAILTTGKIMRVKRPELRIISATILLGTLALALALIIGYAWWSAQQGLSRHAQEEVDIIAQFLENGMALLPQGGADLDGLHVLMEQVGEENGARRLAVARSAAVSRQYGPSQQPYVADELSDQVFHSGQDVTTIETVAGRRILRRLKVLTASEHCVACHDADPGEILGVLDVSFDMARVQPAGPEFYRNLVLVALLVSVILVLLVFLVFSRINMARRIESISVLAGDIATGDLDRRVPSLPGTGMDGLAQTINEMALSLAQQQEILARQQEELEETNRRMAILVQESHHRIKNNLQTVADLLALQSGDCPVGEGSCLRDSIQRIKSIAAVHDLLSGEQSESTDVQQLADRLLGMAMRYSTRPEQRIDGTVRGGGIRLASKEATALALVLGELYNNALLHGLAGRQAGVIQVQVQAEDGRAVIAVHNDGQALPAGFDRRTHQKLGLRIVGTLVERDLGGALALRNVDGGVMATVTFPLRHQDTLER